jgi:hypothetical protein
MLDIFSVIEEAKSLISEGDRGQILLQKPTKVSGDRAGQKQGKNPDPSNVIGKGEKLGKKYVKKVSESKTERGRGSKSGRSAIHSTKDITNPKKSRVRIYNSITDALKRGYMGQPFSTNKSNKLYVITKQKWGTDDEQIINGRSAKGFNDFKDAKRYAVRTMVRHAGSTSKKNKGKKYWKSERK